MKRLLILLLLTPFPAMASPKCQWVSEPNPDAVIRIGDVSPIGIESASAYLLWKGKVVRSLLMGQSNGYGSRWWAYLGNDGKSVGGDLLVPFRGNQPIRGTNPEDLDNTAPKRALLVGLGSDLYYSDMRGERGLITAAEGFWQIPDHCDGRW